MFGRYVGKAIALAGVVGLLALSAPASWSAPAHADTDADSFTLALTDLGFGSTLQFYGLESTQWLTLPVPDGLTPTALHTTVELPINLQSGVITVTQGERTIATLDLPATDQAPIVIPLAGAEVIDKAVTVVVRANLVPIDKSCFRWHSPLRLVNTKLGYAGAEQPPRAVADFLPPVLRRLTIFVPQSPSEAESNGAVHLATAYAAHYATRALEIAVAPLSGEQTAPTAPPRPMERQIVIKDGPGMGLSIQGSTDAPWLLISRPPRGIEGSDIDPLFSDASNAVAGAPKSLPRLPGNTATLSELGMPVLKSAGLRPALSIGLDQTRFGRSFHSVRVHLQGSYTATPANTGAQIVATVGTEPVERWPTDAKGVIDHWVTVPDRLLQRYTAVNLELDESGNLGPCGDFSVVGSGGRVLEFTINGDSTVQTSPAAPPVPDGLRSLPQTLMPVVQVGINPHSFGDTMRAVNIVVGLQRISSVPLVTLVTSAQNAIASPNPAVVIAANGWDHPDIALPISGGATGPITVNAFRADGKTTALTLEPALRFGALQTVFNRGRSLLIATSNGAPAQLDQLLGWLNADEKRWPGLHGVALVSLPGQDPVVIDQMNLGGPTAPPQVHSDWKWLWWAGGVWIAVVAVGAGVIALRGRPGSHRG